MNDERPIEKLLRRAAQKRSDEAGPPPELHPANRRLLQDEVARQFPQPAAAKQSGLADWWALIQRRWLYGAGVIAVLWVAALAIVPLLSKSKSKSQTNLAQNAPSEDRLALERARNAPAAPEPLAVPTVVMEADSSAISPSGSGNFAVVPETAATPRPVAAPAARFNRQTTGRRDAQDVSTTFADSLAVSGTIQPATRGEGKLAMADEDSKAFNRPTPASVALRTQPTRSIDGNEFRVGSGGGNLGFIPADSGLQAKEKMITNGLGVEQQAYYSPGTTTGTKSAALGGAAAEGLADKTWIARGGGVERERAVLNSQAYSNVGQEPWQQARKKAALARKDLVPVLANFKIEQAGRDLRVVDGDGSVYHGVVDEENTLYKQMVARQNQNLSNAYENKFKFQTPKAADASGSLKQQATEYYRYRAEGTNRSLNQNVVFTWNFIETNALAAGNLDYKAAVQKLDATKLPSQFPAMLQNSFINGRAQFGEGREIEVNAVPVK